jgi:ABC-type phosphate transport system substrate-binding protein
MSKTFRTGIAVAGAAAALALVPGSASAAFDTAHDAQCENATTIAGVGASFQRDAQLAWGATLLAPNPGGPNATGFGYATTANGGCSQFAVGGGQSVTYEPKGSGDGRNAFGASTVAGVAGVRNTAYAFGGADEPPTTAQLAAANQGPTAGTSDDAVLHTIPVASSSVAVDIKLPAGCTIANTSTARTISRAAVEGAFAAKSGYTQWGQILPTITGAGCSTKPVRRVVRLDSSGTTFAFKRYLASIDATDFPTSLGNTAWPNDSGATAVLRGTANGAGSQLDALNGLTDGGIAYADLATSRGKAFDTANAADTTFWAFAQRTDGAAASPALNNTTSAAGANRGANCANVNYGTLPATTGSWANVDGTNTGSGYPICTLTYALAWEQASQANVGIPAGQTPISQDQARAVKDYLGFDIKSAGGQSQLAPAGYQVLPTAVQAAAQSGVNALNY